MKKNFFSTLLVCFFSLATFATNVTIGDIFQKYYPVMNSWSVVLTAADNEDWQFNFEISAPATGFVSGQTYSATGGLNDLNNGYFAYTTADYTETFGSDGSRTILANVALNDGRQFTLNYGLQAVPTATDTVQVSFPNATMRTASTSIGDPVIVIAGADATYDISVSFHGATTLPSYTMADNYDYYTHLIISGTPVLVRDVHATTSISGSDFIVDTYILGDNGICYHVLFSYAVPAAKDTVHISATNMLIDESKINQFGQIVLSASNATHYVELWIYTEQLLGNYSGYQIDTEYSLIGLLADESSKKLLAGDVTISRSGNVTTLTGGVLAADTVWYELNLQYIRPTAPTRTMNLTFEYATLDMERISEEGIVYLVGYDIYHDYYLSLMLYTNGETGTFHTAQTDSYETYLATVDGSDTYDLLEDTLTVTLANDMLTITGSLFLQSELTPTDAPLVHITVTAECQTGRALDNSEADFCAYLEHHVMDCSQVEQSGFITLDAANADSTKMAALLFHVTGTHATIGIPTGVYPINNSGFPGTVAVAAPNEGGQLYPSFAALTKENGEPTVPLWYLESGTVTVENHNGELYVEVDALNSFDRKVNIVICNQPKDTIEVVINDCELTQYATEFQFFGPNRDYEAYVAIQSPTLVGNYTWKDANKDYTRIRVKGTEYIDTHDLSCTVSQTENGYLMEAYLLREDGLCHHITFRKYNTPAAATSTLPLSFELLTRSDVWEDMGEWLYTAKNDQYEFMLTLKGDTLGDFNQSLIDFEFCLLTEKLTGAQLHFVDGSVSIQFVPGEDNNEGTLLLNGSLLGKDGVNYTFTTNVIAGLEDILSNSGKTIKIFDPQSGQIFILSSGRIFDILGRRKS